MERAEPAALDQGKAQGCNSSGARSYPERSNRALSSPEDSGHSRGRRQGSDDYGTVARGDGCQGKRSKQREAGHRTAGNNSNLNPLPAAGDCLPREEECRCRQESRSHGPPCAYEERRHLPVLNRYAGEGNGEREGGDAQQRPPES